MNSQTDAIGGNSLGLRRALTLWDLTVYGVVIISPVTAMLFFGILSQRGRGHAATSIIIATFAMLPTAVSYGRMARLYPSAGSAFTYVGRELSPIFGYLVGWSMVLDYVLGPVVCILWCSQQGHVLAPGIPYWVWALCFSVLFTWLNTRGVKISAKVNAAFAAVMGIVIAIFLAAVVPYLLKHPLHSGTSFVRPFYDPQTWTWGAIGGSASIAVLTYLGFDGISTLAEEAENPRRHILQATLIACLVIGVLSVIQVYAAQLVWPSTQPYPDVDTAFTFVAGRVWHPLFFLIGVTLIVSSSGTAIAAQLGAARLLYGMGRSGALPQVFFGAVDERSRIPRNNVLLLGAVAFSGCLVLHNISGPVSGYELGAYLLNFGALIGFMGVNVAAFLHYYLREKDWRIVDLVLPAFGFLLCLVLWCGLDNRAKILGAIWLALGVLLVAMRSRRFETTFDIP